MNATRSVAGALAVAALAVGCGSDESKPQTATNAPKAQTATNARTAPAKPHGNTIVGRWERVQTCKELVQALERAHLGALTASAVTEFFPNATAREIARKPNPCKGAQARPHSHFFRDDGTFGSVDDKNEQVDDGSYKVSGRVLQIGDGRFGFRVEGDTLTLLPVISARDRRRALADPGQFSTAGWQVAVSYMGLPWKRVSCGDWC